MTTMFAMLNGIELGLIGLFATFVLAMTAFWIWALVDCARRVSAGESGLVGWLIAICFTQVLGAAAYLILAKARGDNVPTVQSASLS